MREVMRETSGSGMLFRRNAPNRDASAVHGANMLCWEGFSKITRAVGKLQSSSQDGEPLTSKDNSLSTLCRPKTRHSDRTTISMKTAF